MKISSNKVVLYGADIAMVLGILWLICPAFQAWLNLDRAVQVAGAVGTVGAVWWAMLHANELQAEQACRALDAAGLHACGFLYDLDDAVDQLNDALARQDEDPSPMQYWGRQEEPSPAEERRRKIESQHDRLGLALDLVIRQKTADEIALLVALPNRCAHHLHLGIVVANRLHDEVTSTTMFDTVDHMREELILAWYEDARRVHSHFAVALEAIKAATGDVYQPRS